MSLSFVRLCSQGPISRAAQVERCAISSAATVGEGRWVAVGDVFSVRGAGLEMVSSSLAVRRCDGECMVMVWSCCMAPAESGDVGGSTVVLTLKGVKIRR